VRLFEAEQQRSRELSESLDKASNCDPPTEFLVWQAREINSCR
jgi:hypothetical protein